MFTIDINFDTRYVTSVLVSLASTALIPIAINVFLADELQDSVLNFVWILAMIIMILLCISMIVYKKVLYTTTIMMIVISITLMAGLTGVFIAGAYLNGPLPSNGPSTLVPDHIAVTVMRNDNQIVQRIISTEEVRVNNCDGSRTVTNEVSRTGTVANTVEIDQSYVNNQGEFYVEGVGSVQIGQEIAEEYGLTYGQVEQRERSIVLETKEQTNVAHTIQNIESWQTGEIVILWKDQEVGRYPYLFRTDFDLNYVSATNLGCSE